MNIDIYTKGKKEINQDYIISGNSPIPYIILADGCSSEGRSEQASMLLTLLAESILPYAYDEIIKLAQHNLFSNLIMRKIETLRDMFGFKIEYFSTLTLLWVYDNTVYARFYGDGVFFFKTKDDEIYTYDIEYSNNMPFYLEYLTSDDKMKRYIENLENKAITFYKDGGIEDIYNSKDHSTLFEFRLDDSIESIGIASDGLSSFVSNDLTPIPLTKIVEKCLNFKNTNGAYVSRRMRRMIKEHENEGGKIMDDISIGVISI